MTQEKCATNSDAWSQPTDWDTVCRRASGRRCYNGLRRARAFFRRREVARLLRVQGSLWDRGMQTRLAQQLGVSRATICRDVAYLLTLGQPCRHCGAWTTPPVPD